MIGGNRVAARYAAIPVDRRLVEVYTLERRARLSGRRLLHRARRLGEPGVLYGLELQVIVAVVLGGTAVTGGRGTLVGSMLGVLLVAVLVEGLQAGGSSFWIQDTLPFKFGNLRFVLLGALLVCRRVAQHTAIRRAAPPRWMSRAGS